MKADIEKLYILANLNETPPSKFADSILELFGKEEKETRTSAQNRARWKYLSLVASILSDKGLTYTPDGTTMDVPFTKDNLYHIYWQAMRLYMFPGKRKQLNTKEFSKLVDMVQMLFAKIFDISTPFPNWKDISLDNK